VALNNLPPIGLRLKDDTLQQQGNALLRAFAGIVRRQPMAYTHMLNGWDLALSRPGEPNTVP
jgi:hypothetical protein